MPRFDLLKIIDFLLKPVIILLIISIYCLPVALILFFTIPMSMFDKLNIPDDVMLNIMENYFPFLGKLFQILFPISCILYLIFILYLFIKNGNYLYKYLLQLKIALIPFWIIVTILMIPIILGASFVGWFVVPVFGMFMLPAQFIFAFIFIFHTVLIFTSVSNILFLINLVRKNMINKFIFVLNLLMNLCVSLDIISIIYLKIRYKGIIDNEDKFKIKK